MSRSKPCWRHMTRVARSVHSVGSFLPDLHRRSPLWWLSRRRLAWTGPRAGHGVLSALPECRAEPQQAHAERTHGRDGGDTRQQKIHGNRGAADKRQHNRPSRHAPRPQHRDREHHESEAEERSRRDYSRQKAFPSSTCRKGLEHLRGSRRQRWGDEGFEVHGACDQDQSDHGETDSEEAKDPRLLPLAEVQACEPRDARERAGPPEEVGNRSLRGPDACVVRGHGMED
jgi:hypothetical protein